MKPQNDIFAPTPFEAYFSISSLFFTNCDVLYSYKTVCLFSAKNFSKKALQIFRFRKKQYIYKCAIIRD